MKHSRRTSGGAKGAAPLPEHPYSRIIEREAQKLRSRLGLGDLDRLDPEQLIGTFDHMVVASAGDAVRHVKNGPVLLRTTANRWWATAYKEGDGPWLILYNPRQTETRRRASIMEEVAHIVMGHEPSKIAPCPLSGVPRRTYKASHEKEAYGIGAASLVPFAGLLRLHANGLSHDDVAEHYGVSAELARFRHQITRVAKAV